MLVVCFSESAEKVKTKPADLSDLHPGFEIHVRERGTYIYKWENVARLFHHIEERVRVVPTMYFRVERRVIGNSPADVRVRHHSYPCAIYTLEDCIHT